MASRSQKRRERRKSVLYDDAAAREARALRNLRGMVPKRKDAGITCSIHWAPRPLGKNGRFRPRRDSMRGPLVRGASHKTPKLVNSYVRCFG